MTQIMEQTHAPRLLIISHDAVGSRMAGTGIRYWEIARVLARQQPVTLIAPHRIDLQPTTFRCATYAWGAATSLQAWLREADVVLANGVVLQVHPELAQLDQPLALDLYDPTLLENLELYRSAPSDQRLIQHQNDTALLTQQLAAGDFFLCATERQRDLYIGALMTAGRITPEVTDHDPQLRNLIDVVPFGLPPEPPAKQQPALRGVLPGIGQDDPLVLWAGGLWDWMDPLSLIKALPQVVERHPNLRVVLLAGQHPGNEHRMRVPQQARELAATLSLLNKHVLFYEEWVPYDRRADVLLEADTAVSLHHPHLETRYASVRSRILDHLWAGLPSILSDGDPAAELLGKAGAALVVAPQQPDQVAAALLQLLGDAALREAQAQAAKQLAAHYTWPKVIEPLAAFSRSPRRTRTSVAQPPQPQATTDVVPVIDNIDPALQQHVELLQACQRAALAVQERTWRLQEQLPATGRFRRLRRLLVQQIVRPFVIPLIEQQREHNLALLRSMEVLVETSSQHRALHEQLVRTIDTRIQVLEHEIEQLAHIPTLNHRMGIAEQHLRTIRQQLYEFTEQLAGLEDADSQLSMALHHPNGASQSTHKGER